MGNGSPDDNVILRIAEKQDFKSIGGCPGSHTQRRSADRQPWNGWVLNPVTQKDRILTTRHPPLYLEYLGHHNRVDPEYTLTGIIYRIRDALKIHPQKRVGVQGGLLDGIWLFGNREGQDAGLWMEGCLAELFRNQTKIKTGN